MTIALVLTAFLAFAFAGFIGFWASKARAREAKLLTLLTERVSESSRLTGLVDDLERRDAQTRQELETIRQRLAEAADDRETAFDKLHAERTARAQAEAKTTALTLHLQNVLAELDETRATLEDERMEAQRVQSKLDNEVCAHLKFAETIAGVSANIRHELSNAESYQRLLWVGRLVPHDKYDAILNAHLPELDRVASSGSLGTGDGSWSKNHANFKSEKTAA